MCQVAIIGAGPYGLSIAAHLGAYKVPFRIFGSPMSAWSTQMPKGMRLKSEGFASSLSDPASEFTLRNYCQQQGLDYADTGRPVPLETFVSYGLAFQKKYAPDLEEKLVTSVKGSPAGFELELDGGEKLLARRVVVAAGVKHFWHVPQILKGLPKGLVSHSSEHSDLERFRGRDVAVIGAGASALDLSALLHQAGASVQLIARRSRILFHDPPRPRSLGDRLFRPMTGLGAGLQMYFYVNAPLIFRCLSEELRLDRVRKVLGPAPAWFIKDQVVGKFPMHLGVTLSDASAQNGRVVLHLKDGDGHQLAIEADHVIAATGYQVNLNRLEFLSQEMRESIRTAGNAPELSANFESSVHGLYFVGASAANTFGPLMRFAHGAHFTARRIAKHLERTAHGKGVLWNEAENARVLEHE